jgi:glucokinase
MRKKIAVGIDIGGTNTAFGFVDATGHCLYESFIPTLNDQDAGQLFERLYQAIDESMGRISDTVELCGIGIGAPNANYYKGTVEYPPNLKWGYVNVLDIMSKYSQLRCVITNDANAAAIGEMQFGAAKGMKDFIVITLGTGVGSGIVSGGALLYGHDGFAGEIGHTNVVANGRECGCGRRGCLETYASASGICRTVFSLLADRNDASILRSYSFNTLTAKSLFETAIAGDPIAMEAFGMTGVLLGKALADAVAYTSPEAIILFGGLANAGKLLFEPTYKAMEENMLNIFKGKVKLLPSGMKTGNAAILGAAALLWKELEEDPVK